MGIRSVYGQSALSAQTRPGEPSFEGDQVSPCNAHTFPGAKIISGGMWPVSVTGHTALIPLSFLSHCDMIKFRVYESFSIFFLWTPTKKNFC